MNQITDEKKWVIQRCIDVWTNNYENWPGYCEVLMTRKEMVVALEECNAKWSAYEFRGHNVEGDKKLAALVK